MVIFILFDGWCFWFKVWWNLCWMCLKIDGSWTSFVCLRCLFFHVIFFVDWVHFCFFKIQGSWISLICLFIYYCVNFFYSNLRFMFLRIKSCWKSLLVSSSLFCHWVFDEMMTILFDGIENQLFFVILIFKNLSFFQNISIVCSFFSYERFDFTFGVFEFEGPQLLCQSSFFILWSFDESFLYRFNDFENWNNSKGFCQIVKQRNFSQLYFHKISISCLGNSMKLFGSTTFLCPMSEKFE